NSIEGHFYGMAIINGASPNLGNLSNADTTDDGGNLFLGNGIGNNRYELYNNNSLPILAEGNWWGTDNPDSIEARIVHQPDNPSFGLVDYIPFLNSNPTGIGNESGQWARQPGLFANYPNPFNSTTTITFALRQSEQVQLTVYDALGRKLTELVNSRMPAGEHRLHWNGTDRRGRALPSGIYFYRLHLGDRVFSRKMMLLR
ncbi:MAG: T9SS type A sorting domain-containing protein, partial [Calditrichia bacterium]